MAVASTDSTGGTSTGEQAGASAMITAAGGGGAFSLGQSAYNGQTVYYGARPGRTTEYETQGRRAAGAPVWVTPQQAYQDYFNWTDAQRKDLTSMGIVSGQVKSGAGDMETAAWWKTLVEQSARYGAAGSQVSPLDLAKGYVDAAGTGLTDQERYKLQVQRSGFPTGAIFDSGGKYTGWRREGEFQINEETGERQYIGPQFKTRTETRVDLTDPQTARALTQSMFQQLLGRDPGPGEYGQFADALKAAEQANPTVQNITEQYDAQGNVIASNTQAVGALRGALSQQAQQKTLADIIKSSPEYGTQQATTTYMEATKRAIWGGPTA